MTKNIREMSIEEKEEYIRNKIQEEEDDYKNKEKIVANEIVAILKNNKFSFAQIEWILPYVLEEIRNIPLNFE